MAKNSAKEDERKGRARFIDQPGQWRSTATPAQKKRLQNSFKAVEASLTPAQRRAMGLPVAPKPKTKPKKKK